MNPRRALSIAFAVLGIGAVVLGVLQFQAAQRVRTSTVDSQRRQEALAARIATIETQLQAAEKRSAAVKDDNTLLATALERAQAAKAVPPHPLTPQEVDERFKRAREMSVPGDPAIVLRELLWCYDEGYPHLNSSTRSRDMAFVAYFLGELSERYPPAREALRERAEKLRAQLLSPTGDAQHVVDLSALLRALKDETTLMSLYDLFPPGDRRRKNLAIYGFDQLLAARRYQEASTAATYATMLSGFEMAIRIPSEASTKGKIAVRTAAKNIEVLAGIGDIAHAREFSETVLKQDPSPEARAVLQTHLTRAGQPDLLNSLSK